MIPDDAPRRAELIAALRADMARLSKHLDKEKRIRRLQRGTSIPMTAAERTIADEGAARRAKRLARRKARATAALSERFGPDVIDLDALDRPVDVT